MAVTIDICVCTFRRDHVAKTLLSISKARLNPDWQVRIIVSDNDETPSAQSLVTEVAAQINLPVTYIHSPSCNISIARNACLDEAKAQYIAFIDDDELVTENWLVSLMDTCTANGADVVFGSVQAIYGDDCPPWMADIDLHSTNPVWVGGEIKSGYCGNVLFKRNSPTIKGLRFNIDLGKTGGEDTIFFSSIYKAGGKLDFASNALVHEPVPQSRSSFNWLAKRRFRAGQTHGTSLLENAGGSRLKAIILATTKAIFSLAAAPLFILRKDRFYFWILRSIMHIGVACRLLGKREIVQYGGKDKT